MGKLRTGLIDRARRQGQRVTERQRLILVVKAGRGRRGIERAGTTRVAGRDVIQAVAHAEVIVGSELVIDLTEHVHTMNRVGIDARRNPRPWITDGREPRVDDRGVGVADCRQPGLIQQALLSVGEEERAVSGDRPAQTSTVLLLRHRQLRSRTARSAR